MTMIAQLADLLGVLPSFIHAGGYEVALPGAVRDQLVRALGHDPDDPDRAAGQVEALRAAAWRRALPPAAVVVAGDAAATVPVTWPQDGPGTLACA